MTNVEFGYYTIKDDIFLENQRYAGKVLVKAMNVIIGNIKPGISTKQLNDIGEECIRSHIDCIPTFLGYRDFPASFCISIGNEIVHGIPKEDRIIKENDIVKIDGGVTYKGAIADMAKTIAVGEVDAKTQLLIEYCEKSLNNAIEFIDKNRDARLGDVGYIIKKTASHIGANVIEDLSGHGIHENILHWFPEVKNVGEKGKGIRLQPGMTIAIEPMLLFGSNKIKTLEDNWTIITETIAAHFEKTIFIHKDRVEIIT